MTGVCVLIDGVTFQQDPAGGGVWQKMLTELAADPHLELHLLDRGGAPIISGVRSWSFPALLSTIGPGSTKHWSQPAADSCLVQQFCDLVSAAAFFSTAYTTPVTTRSLLCVLDDFSEGQRGDTGDDVERKRAMAHASLVVHTRQARTLAERLLSLPVMDSTPEQAAARARWKRVRELQSSIELHT